MFLNKRFSIIFWFIFPILLLIVCYGPFEQPIFFDRSYLLYMSQVVFRGDPLYAHTTFGYTPLSTLIVGYVMKFGSLFSLTTVESARIFGILFYGCTASAFYCLAKALYNQASAIIISCLLFTGLDYIAILSGINAEPKLWVLLFSILGLLYFHQNKWLLCGLSFSIAAMCWHVAVVSLFACGLTLLLLRKDIFTRFKWLLTGVLLGTLPVLFYLLFTDQWLDFWQQAVVRKINLEGDTLGESPFYWLVLGIYPWFTTELPHFALAAIGFFILAFSATKGKQYLPCFTQKQASILFLFVYTLLWSVFNSMEFQSNVDLFPLIPTFVIFAGYAVMLVLKKAGKIKYAIVLGILIVYNYYNAVIYKQSSQFSEQLSNYKKMDEQYGHALAIGFSSYYVVLEKPAPTKYVNFYHHISSKTDCKALVEAMKKNRVSYIIDIDRQLRKRSRYTQNLFDFFGLNDTKLSRTYCATEVLNSKNIRKEKAHFEINTQSILLSDLFHVTEKYFVYKIIDNRLLGYTPVDCRK